MPVFCLKISPSPKNTKYCDKSHLILAIIHLTPITMPKIKTHKATAKRFRMTKTRKIKQRKAGQDHFNARESGKTVRNKRRDIDTHKSFIKTVKILIQK
jgi:large subunit ribosomal protein L35